MNRFRLLINAAGMANISAANFAIGLFVSTVLVGLLVTTLTGIPAFFATGAVFTRVGIIELVRGVAAHRESNVVAALPELAENLATVLASGADLQQALCELAKTGPLRLRKTFERYGVLVDRGLPLDSCLDWLQSELSNVYADQLLELLKVTESSGGSGIVVNLNRVSKVLRDEIVLRGELQAKQGWVLGTAKVAVLAPWLIAAMLARRPEALTYYSSNVGTAMLLTGLVACAVAYWLIGRFASTHAAVRVFAK